MLICLRPRRRIGAYLDGALGESARRGVGAHLAACARCQRDADELRRLRAALRRDLPVAPAPDWTGFWAGVARGIAEGRARAPLGAGRPWAGWLWPGGRWPWRPRLAFGGALAAAALISLTLWQASYPPAAPEGAVVVRSARTDAPGGSVMVYSPPERDLAVIWVFGLE